MYPKLHTMSSPPAKEQNRQHLNNELRDVISILTGLRKLDDGGADDAMGIITLSGTNKGAMMKMESPQSAVDQTSAVVNSDGREGTEAIANSNYQSINNSIVIGGSCGAEDPGVHLLIQDYVEGDEGVEEYHESKRKEKKKDKEIRRGKGNGENGERSEEE